MEQIYELLRQKEEKGDPVDMANLRRQYSEADVLAAFKKLWDLPANASDTSKVIPDLAELGDMAVLLRAWESKPFDLVVARKTVSNDVRNGCLLIQVMEAFLRR